MQHFSCALIAVALLAAVPVLGQSAAPTGEAVTVASPPLSAEKQLEIKTSIARFSRALKPGQDLPRVTDKLAVGATVPGSVQLITLPQDTVTEVPTTTSYRFVLMGDSIAVVEPETRKVLQIIE
jgi:hypothetical protein